MQGRLVGMRRFIYFDNAFHGRTIFALNITQIPHDPLITEDFRGFVQGNLQVPFPAADVEDLKRYLRSVPSVAPRQPKALLVVSIAFFPVLFNVRQGMSSIDEATFACERTQARKRATVLGFPIWVGTATAPFGPGLATFQRRV